MQGHLCPRCSIFKGQGSSAVSQRKISGGQSHFWQRLWRHRCAVNHDATFLLWSAYQHWWRNLFHSVGAMGVRRVGDKMGICSLSKLANELNRLCLENLMSTVLSPILIELILTMTVCFPVWHSHCTRASFTVLVSCRDELLTVHSRPLICLQRQIAKLGKEFLCYWTLLRNNNIPRTIFQRFTSSCGNRCFAACDCWTQASWQVLQRDSYCW